MKRVAALYLPQWPIERLRRAEPLATPPEARAPEPQARGGGWRPGARWAKDERALSNVVNGEGAIVTSLRDGSRVIIGAACPRALALGLTPGMALSQARAQVRGLDIRPADPEGDRAALHALALAFARRFSPIVAVSDQHGLFIDITGTTHLFGGEERMARRLIRLLAQLGFTARIAIADTPGAAHALVRHACADRGYFHCPAHDHGKALIALPVQALRLQAAQTELLARFGIDTIGQLCAVPRAPLVRRFGALIVTQLHRALGDLPEPLDPVVPVQPIAATRRFAEPILTADAIGLWLGTLVPELAEALAEAGIGTTRMELIAERIDGVPQCIRIGLARPSRDPEHLLRLLTRRIETIEPGFGIDALTLHVRRADTLGPQPVVERLDEEAAPDLAPLVDTLATRIGLNRLWRMQPVESDVPERAAARAAVLDPPPSREAQRKRDDVRQLDRSVMQHPWHPLWPKPVRLLHRPERVDHVMAELPDHAPRRFTWRGEAHRIVHADGPERVHGEWWKREAERHSVRDYFRVEDDTGRRYWLFRKGDGERSATGDLSWYLHGVFG